MKILKLEHEEGARIPFGWAVSHRDFLSQTTICYPIGIHFIVRWSRDIFFWLMSVGRPSWRQTLEHKIYVAGLEQGSSRERAMGKYREDRQFKLGLEEGRIQATVAALKVAQEKLDEA